jgi:hypothetical protein
VILNIEDANDVLKFNIPQIMNMLFGMINTPQR